MMEEDLVIIRDLVNKVYYLETELENLREDYIRHEHPKCFCMNRIGGI